MTCQISESKTSKGLKDRVDTPKLSRSMLENLRAEQLILADDKDLHWVTRARATGGRVFGFVEKTSIDRPWKEICAKAGIQYVPPHEAVRYTFATNLSQRLGWSAEQIAGTGRWSKGSIAMLQQVYIHSARGTYEAAEALSAFVPGVK